MNYIIGHAAPPRFGANAKIARIDIDADGDRHAARYVDIPIVGDCKVVLQQLLDGIKGKVTPDSYKAWRKKLADGEAAKRSGRRRQQVCRGWRHPSGADAGGGARTSPSATRSCASTGRRR